jgi:hypothetical protein
MIEVVYLSVMLKVLSTFYCLWLIRDVRKVFHIFIIEKNCRIKSRDNSTTINIFDPTTKPTATPIPTELPVHSSHGN